MSSKVYEIRLWVSDRLFTIHITLNAEQAAGMDAADVMTAESIAVDRHGVRLRMPALAPVPGGSAVFTYTPVRWTAWWRSRQPTECEGHDALLVITQFVSEDRPKRGQHGPPRADAELRRLLICGALRRIGTGQSLRAAVAAALEDHHPDATGKDEAALLKRVVRQRQTRKDFVSTG